MPKSVGSILHAITFLALTSGAAAVLADPGSSPGQRGGVMGDTGGAGMMRSMRGMMQGCGAMMQSGAHSGRPNEQWREDRRSTPDRYECRPVMLWHQTGCSVIVELGVYRDR